MLEYKRQGRHRQLRGTIGMFGVARFRPASTTLEARLEPLGKNSTTAVTQPPKEAAAAAETPPASAASASTASSSAASTLSPATDFLRGTTLNFLFDAYYDFNFNNPLGRVNLLRAYDVTSNAFSLNQADVVLENPADPANGKRFGLRLDLQFGQATETLQGSASNELRPDVWRNLYQVYGTYVIPVGNGLTVDFGKWASSPGIEGNYPKDQMNYSRSYWFDFLPFYHTGLRPNYKVNDPIALNYWLTMAPNRPSR